jgi:hypothetical protein
MTSKTEIVLKKSSIPDKIPEANALVVGEIAVNLVDKKLYSKTTSEEVIQIGSGSLYGLDDTSNIIPTDKNFLQFNVNEWDYREVSPVITLNVSGHVVGNTSIILNNLESNVANLILQFNSDMVFENINVTSNVNVGMVTTSNTFVGIGTGFSNIELLTSGSSWSIPENVKKWKVTVIGGGGQGGGSRNQVRWVGAGGGSGAVAVYIFNRIDGINTMSYSIGQGGNAGGNFEDGQDGTSTTATYNSYTVTGGGGSGGLSSATNEGRGAGGVSTNGILNLNGFFGYHGGREANENSPIGTGGDTPLGYGVGGKHTGLTTVENGQNGEGIGSGGSGSKAGTSGTAARGGFGANGAIIVEY